MGVGVWVWLAGLVDPAGEWGWVLGALCVWAGVGGEGVMDIPTGSGCVENHGGGSFDCMSGRAAFSCTPVVTLGL